MKKKVTDAMRTIAAANPSDIPAGTMKAVTADGTKILLANIGGTFHAIAATCPHMGADLCQGRLVGSIVTCPRHAAGFDVTTGRAVDPAKILFLKMKTKDAAAFAVSVEDGQVLIDI